MKKPNMILFDYGDTLLCEPEFDAVRGMRALVPYITKNPEPCLPETLAAESLALFEEYAPVRRMGFELHEWPLNRLLFGSHGIVFSLDDAQIEQIFWENACPGAVMPYAAQLLDFLQEAGIRTGVVSNIGWSSAALLHRLDRLLPNHHFEFVMTSSDYLVRKPDERLFRTACQNAGLPPETIWYCGDNFRCDVLGAAGAGMQPVWYNPAAVNAGIMLQREGDVDPLCIRDWRELIEILKEMDL